MTWEVIRGYSSGGRTRNRSCEGSSRASASAVLLPRAPSQRIVTRSLDFSQRALAPRRRAGSWELQRASAGTVAAQTNACAAQTNKRVRGATKNSCAAFNWKAHEKINLNHRVLNAMHSSESCYIPFYLRFQMSVQNIFSAHFFSKNGQENSERVP